jgi:hypothetical protein
MASNIQHGEARFLQNKKGKLIQPGVVFPPERAAGLDGCPCGAGNPLIARHVSNSNHSNANEAKTGQNSGQVPAILTKAIPTTVPNAR